MNKPLAAWELTVQYQAQMQKYPNLYVQVLRATLAKLLAVSSVQAATKPVQTEVVPVRDLDIGKEGNDVKRLQELLIGKGYRIPAGATGYFGTQTAYALDAYQVKNNIAPRGGYFGPITRAQMKAADLANLWW